MKYFVLAAVATSAFPGWASGATLEAPHYRVLLNLDPVTRTLASDVTVTFPAELAVSGAALLLSRSYRVSWLSSSANAVVAIAETEKPFPGLQRITVMKKPGMKGDVSVTVRYAGPLASTEDLSTNEISQQRVELSADSLWYPLSENFNLRFTFDLTVRGLDPDFVVASPDIIEPLGKGFALHRSVPSQDIAFLAAPGLRHIAKGHLQFFSKNPESDRSQSYLTNGPKAVRFLENWFGSLPRGRAVVAIAHRENGTGYSRPGYLVVADTGTAAAPDDNWGRLGYIAHELSHSWWSDADFTGEDYWLVESTAEYTALRFIEQEEGSDSLRAILEGKRPRAARGGPILGHGRPSGDAVYAKGPLLLFELERTIGRNRLDKLLRRLAVRKRITSQDFLSELAKVSTEKVSNDFEAKLRS